LRALRSGGKPRRTPPALRAMLTVALALVPARATGLGPSPKSRPRHPRLESRLAGEDPTRSVAHVGAVEVEPHAARERLGVPFYQAGVGTSRAALDAVEAGIGALHRRGSIHGGGVRMSLEHLLGVAQGTSFL